MYFTSNSQELNFLPDDNTIEMDQMNYKSNYTNVDRPMYLLEHLATFTVNKELGIVFPADGMRRLLQLEKTSGIWLQQIELCLDEYWIQIIDCKSDDIIEKFPVDLIEESTAFTSDGPLEIYNNILVLIVANTTNEKSRMHIFQCQNISAVYLMEEIKKMRENVHEKEVKEFHEENRTSQWICNVLSNGGIMVQVKYSRLANNDEELTVVHGEYLEILDNTRNWWKAINNSGQIGYVPCTIVIPYEQDDLELNVRNNLIEENDEAAASTSDLSATTVVECFENQKSFVKLSTTIAPPPPPPPPPVNIPTVQKSTSTTNTLSRQTTLSSKDQGQEQVQEELKQVLSLHKRKRFSLDIVKTPDIFIEQTATSKEVENWLKVKGFSSKVLDKLHGINGEELFALRRAAIEEAFDDGEGKRLASQLTVQRNISGYKTARSSELAAILERARKKTEEKV